MLRSQIKSSYFCYKGKHTSCFLRKNSSLKTSFSTRQRSYSKGVWHQEQNLLDAINVRNYLKKNMNGMLIKYNDFLFCLMITYVSAANDVRKYLKNEWIVYQMQRFFVLFNEYLSNIVITLTVLSICHVPFLHMWNRKV